MATISNFEELDIWRNARILTKLVYEDFQQNKDFGFKDQIQRAAISIMNNIAEGFGRDHDAEFRNFLNFSKGSVTEVKNMYYIAEDLKYQPVDTCNNRRNALQGLANGIGAFMEYLKKSGRR